LSDRDGDNFRSAIACFVIIKFYIAGIKIQSFPNKADLFIMQP
jgi:hypothetical protein